MHALASWIFITRPVSVWDNHLTEWINKNEKFNIYFSNEPQTNEEREINYKLKYSEYHWFSKY